MPKVLEVTFSDKRTYAVPAGIIAEIRARYYAASASQRRKEAYHTVFDRELALGLECDEELLDWAGNDVDWKQLAESAVLVDDCSDMADYHREWANATKRVVEVSDDDAG